MIGILLVDDHDIVRTGIRLIIDADPNMKVVGEARDGDEVVALSRKLKPQIVLMDIHMQRVSGIEATARLHAAMPEVRIIILTMQGSGTLPRRMLASGANGYLSKGCPASELLESVRMVAAGRSFIGADIAQQMALTMLPGAALSPFETLSSRELEVALAFARGEEAIGIANRLHIGKKTVATYKCRLMGKLDIKNEVELARLAQRHGLIEQPAAE